ncbi:MAG: outer membrane biosynthesis protein TonB [Myxococcota bacterium]|jgi:outer membrane biosynthesis protein TonB
MRTLSAVLAVSALFGLACSGASETTELTIDPPELPIEVHEAATPTATADPTDKPSSDKPTSDKPGSDVEVAAVEAEPEPEVVEEEVVEEEVVEEEVEEEVEEPTTPSRSKLPRGKTKLR